MNILRESGANYYITHFSIKQKHYLGDLQREKAHKLLQKRLQFQLTFWCGNFVDKQGNCSCKSCMFPKNFHTRKLSQISVFYAVKNLKLQHSHVSENRLELFIFDFANFQLIYLLNFSKYF